MSEIQQSFHRNVDTNKHGDKRSAYKEELSKLFNVANCNEYKALVKLRSKYTDNRIVEEQYAEFRAKLDRIKRKSLKFKEQIYSKYGSMHVSFPVLVKKARKYMNKYKLSEEEFDCFMRFALSDNRFNQTNTYNVPNTEMSKTLGFTSAHALNDKLYYKEEEKQYLDNILKHYEVSKALHEQIKMQTITYYDTAAHALTGEFDRRRNNPYSYVHPVIAALFLPKVRYIEEIMLLGNIGNIIKQKKDGYMLQTNPDYELYWSIITDPNDMVCATMRNSPLKDLETRYRVQIKLWESVFALRQGRYYDEKLTDFIQSLDKCPNNIIDSPELSLIKDEGTILRKLLGVFSFRPTTINVSPVHNNFMPLTVTGQITNIPMVTMYLPPRFSTSTAMPKVQYNINMVQQRYFIENKTIVQKLTTIMYSRDVFFLYVPRRFYNVDLTSYTTPFSFNRLPVTVGNIERLNDTEFDFPWELQFNGSDFNLRSVVFVDTLPENDNIIIGQSAGIISLPDSNRNQFESTCYVYAPQEVAAVNYDRASGMLDSIQPIYVVDKFNNTGVQSNGIVVPILSFTERASKSGTIFMYVKSDASNISIITN